MDAENTPYLSRKTESINGTEVVYTPVTNKKGKQEFLLAEKTSVARDSLFLYFSSLTVDLTIFATACTLVWSSPAFQKLKSTDLEINPLGIPLTSLQESCIAALPSLGATIGPILFGRLADTYGRKKTIMLFVGLKIVSYIILAFATHIYLYYITRFFLGIGLCMCIAVGVVYTGEICEDHNRGKFGCILWVFAALGTLYTLSIGPLLSLKMLTLSCTIPLIFVFISFIFVIPETPIYLASKGDKENAIKALMKLRNKTRSVAETDLHEILQRIGETSSSFNDSKVNVLKTPAVRKGLMMCLGLSFFQQFSGYNAIFAFIGPIFELSGSDISANLSSIVVATVQVFTILVASTLIEKLGRRLLLLISIISTLMSLILLAIYFCLKDNEFYYIQSISWLPVASLIIYVIFYNIGLGPVPWTLLSEVFPSNFNSTASSVVSVFISLVSFFVIFSLPLVIECIGMAGCCCLLGGFCALGTVFIYTIVPETKGKAIGDIQKILSK